MFSFFKNLLGSKINLDEVFEQGALIIDVRTKGEFENGHIIGSVNIPLNVLSSQISKLKKEVPIVTCCASGMRSASAKSILKSNGFNQVYNGGSWMSLKRFEKK
jgi:phage shock protein E